MALTIGSQLQQRIDEEKKRKQAEGTTQYYKPKGGDSTASSYNANSGSRSQTGSSSQKSSSQSGTTTYYRPGAQSGNSGSASESPLERVKQKLKEYGIGVQSPTSQQSLQYKPTQESIDKNSPPKTLNEAYARAYYITDPEQKKWMFNSLDQLSRDKTSVYYQPYATATHPAVEYFASRGYDMSKGITNEWLEKNSHMMQDYRTGTSGTPLAPSKKSTPAQNDAYWYYQAWQAYDTTNKVEAETKALQDEVNYWAKHPANYSDAQIMEKIGWSNYKTLDSLDKGVRDGVPVKLLRGTDYSRDNVPGMIWAARNGGSSGNIYADSAAAINGLGTVWSANPDIDGRLDPKSDRYNPYAVTATVDDAGMYFGRYAFDQQWVKDNDWMARSSDETQRKNYAKVVEAEKTTQAAETELTALNTQIDKWVARGYSADKILEKIEESGDYKTLMKLKDSLTNGRGLVATTRAVDFDWNDLTASLNERCAKVAGDDLITNGDNLNASMGVPGNTSSTDAAVNAAGEAKLGAAADIIERAGTKQEKGLFSWFRSTTTAIGNFINNLAGAKPDLVMSADAMHAADQRNLFSNFLTSKQTTGEYETRQERLRANQEALDRQLQLIKEQEEKRDNAPVLTAGAAAVRNLDPGVKQAILSTLESSPESAASALQSLGVAPTDVNDAISALLREDGGAQETAWTAQDENWLSVLHQREAELEKLIQEDQDYLDQNADSYAKTVAEQQRMAKNMALTQKLAKDLGVETEGGTKELELLNFVYDIGSNREQPLWSAYSVYDTALANGMGDKEVHQYAFSSIRDNVVDIRLLESVLQQIDEYGISTPGGFKENIQRKIDDLRRDNIGSGYFLLDQAKDFDKIAKETRDKFEQITFDDAVRANYEGLLMVNNWASDRFSDVDGKTTTKYGPYIGSLTDAEKDRYFYLVGAEGYEAANKYLDYLTDGEHGVLTTRTSQDIQQRIRDITSKDGLSAALMTGVSWGANLFSGAGTFYSIKQWLTGGDINPDNPAFWTGAAVNTIRGTTSEMISNATGGSEIATDAYSILNSTVDSLLSSVFTKDFIGAMGAGKVVGSLLGATPMGVRAAETAMRDATFRGASPSQAVALGAANFAAEVFSESFTYSNIIGGEEAALAGGLKDWLLGLPKDGLEEAFGEGITEYIESKADTWIMGEMSNRATKIKSYTDAGYPTAVAEMLADQEIVSNVAHAAFVGFVSSAVHGAGGYLMGKVEDYVGAARTRVLEAREKARGFTRPNVNTQQTQDVENQGNTTVSEGDQAAITSENGNADDLYVDETEAPDVSDMYTPPAGQVKDIQQEQAQLAELNEQETAATPEPVTPPAGQVKDIQQEQAQLAELNEQETAADVDLDEYDAEDTPLEAYDVDNEALAEQDAGALQNIEQAEAAAQESAVNEAKTVVALKNASATPNDTTSTVSLAAALNAMEVAPLSDSTNGGSYTSCAAAAELSALTSYDPHQAADFVLDLVAENHDAPASLKVDLGYILSWGALTDGETHQVLVDSMPGPVNTDLLKALNEAFQNDQNNASFADMLNVAKNKVKEYRIGQNVIDQIAAGGMDGIEPLKAQEAQKTQNLANAQAGLEQVQNQIEAAQGNLEVATSEMLANADNPASGQPVQNAVKDLEGLHKVATEYEQSVANAQADLNAAQEKTAKAETDTLTEIRQTAKATVEQQMQAEADAAAAAAQAQADADAAAQAQAQADAQAAYDNAVAQYKPTKAFGQVVQMDITGNETVDAIGVVYHDKDSTIFMTADGRLINDDNVMSYLGDGQNTITDTLINWKAKDNVGTTANPVAAWFDHVVQMTDPDTNETVGLLGISSVDTDGDLWALGTDGYYYDLSTMHGSNEDASYAYDVFYDNESSIPVTSSVFGGSTAQPVVTPATNTATTQASVTAQQPADTTTTQTDVTAQQPADTTTTDQTVTAKPKKPKNPYNEKIGKNEPDPNLVLLPWQNPDLHGKVKKLNNKKLNPKSKKFKEFFNDPTPEKLLSNPDGSPKVFFRGYGDYGSTLYVNHESSGGIDDNGNRYYINFYSDTKEVSETYAGTKNLVGLRDMVNWETAAAAMKDIGYELKVEQNPSTGEWGYQLYKNGSPVSTNKLGKTWFAENELDVFRHTYGGGLKHKGIHMGYLSAQNPLVVDAGGKNYASFPVNVTASNGQTKVGNVSTDSLANWAFKHTDFDAVIVKNVKDTVSGSGPATNIDVITRYPNQFKSIFNNGEFSKNATNIAYNKVTDGKFVLTGEPVSTEAKSASEKMALGTMPTQAEYEAVPEMKYAKEHATTGSSVDGKKMWELINNGDEEGAKGLFTPKQLKKHVEIVKDILSQGSAVIDAKGGISYTGEVENGHRLDIVIGGSSAGKSTLVSSISEQNKSGVFDSDDVKAKLDGYRNGLGSGYVSAESQFVNRAAYQQAMEEGRNIIIPTVGSNVNDVKDLIHEFKDAGYNVHLHYTALTHAKRLGRNLDRTISTGRYLPTAYLFGQTDELFENNYSELKSGGLVDDYTKWSTDVPKGAKPLLVESNNPTAGVLGQHPSGAEGVLVEGSPANAGGQVGQGARQVNIAPGTNRTEKPKSGQEIIARLANDLGMVPEARLKKYLRRLRNTTKGYTYGNGVVHILDAQDVKTAVHEIGHNLDTRLGMQAMVEDMGALRENYDKTLGPGFLSQYSGQEAPGELMAELTRLWLQNRNYAVQIAGEDFVDKFETALRENGMLNAMKDASDAFAVYDAADDSTKLQAMIHFGGPEKARKTVGERATDFAAKWADGTIKFLKMTNQLKRNQNGSFSYADDTRTLLLANPNVVGNMVDSFIAGEGLVDPQGNLVINPKTGEPYGSARDVLSAVDRRDKPEFVTYWAALAAKERAAAGKDVVNSDIDVDAVIAKYSKEHPEWLGVIEDFEDMFQGLMQTWCVDTGNMRQEELDRMRAMYPHYLPMFTVDAVGSGGPTNVDGVPQIGVRRAYGSTADKDDPISHYMAYAQTYIGNAKQIEALRAFDKQMQFAIDNHLDVGIHAERAQPDVISRMSANSAFREKMLAIKDWLQKTNRITDVGAQDLLDGMAEVPDFVFKDHATGTDIVNVPMPDGSVHSWTVYDEDIVKALMRTANPSQIPAVARLISKATRFLCANATSRSMGFVLHNLASDTETAMNTGRGGILGRLWPTYVAKQVGSAFDLLRNEVAASDFGQKRGWQVSDQYRLFRLFGQLGHRYSFTDQKTRQQMPDKVFGGKKPGVEKAKTVIKYATLIKPVEKLSEFFEDMTRYTEFRSTGDDLSTYEGRLRAGQNSREATTDFSKSGTATSDRAFLNAIVPFFSSSTQGVYKTVRMFSSENEGNRVRTAARIAINSIFHGAVLAALRGAMWNDDEKEAYKQLSPYEKCRYWHVKLPSGRFVRVKRSQDGIVQIADAIGNFLGDVMTGYEDGDLGSFINITKEVANNIMIDTAVGIAPFIDAANNRTWFGGAIDDSRALKSSVTGRYDASTRTSSRLLSYIINPVVKTVFDVEYSPNAIEDIENQYLGSFGSIGSGLVSMFTNGNVSTEAAISVLADHLSAKFTVDPVYSNGISTTFYDGRTRINELLQEAGDEKSPESLRYNLTPEQREAAYKEAEALVGDGGAVDAAYKNASRLWKEHDRILSDENLTQAERKAKARDVRQQINREYTVANIKMADFWKTYGYSNGLEQNAMNALNIFTNNKTVIQSVVDERETNDRWSSAYNRVFSTDNSGWYERARDISTATGLTKALPKPQRTFEKAGEAYTVEESYWSEYMEVYLDAFVDYLDKKEDDYTDAETDEARAEVFNKAKNSASNKAKDWYLRNYK